MRHECRLPTMLLLLLVKVALADDPNERPTLVIDTDMGLDDAVTVAMALQSPGADIVAIVAVEGAAGQETAVNCLERMLDLFNRRDIPLYAPATVAEPKPPPAFRPFAEAALSRALSPTRRPIRRPFSAEAYGTAPRGTVLALGPLTNVAAALRTSPEIRDRVDRIVVAGRPHPQDNWNLAYDAEAWAAVKASGLRVEFVASNSVVRKPRSWHEGAIVIGPGTSIGEGFVRQLLADARTREHYLAQWPGFSDELAFLYCLDSGLFVSDGVGEAFMPRESQALLDSLLRGLGEGRQRKQRVVFADGPLPATTLPPDLRQRQAAIIAKNGEVEWFVALLTSELHDHLGAYSVIGAKMGLRAAELLNAPPHAMKVVSCAAAGPPVSCLNDGLIVATGSTPGRGLFTHTPKGTGSTEVRFAYNGREVALSVKAEYREKIATEIRRLERHYGLERHEYWDSVRRAALEIWENWHRRDIFEIHWGPGGQTREGPRSDDGGA